MNEIAIALVILAIALYVATYFLAPAKAIAGLRASWRIFTDPKIALIPLIAASILIAGLLQASLPTETVAGYLGEKAGVKGLVIGSAMGALMPGGPYVAFPIAGALWKLGAGVGTLIAFISAWSLLAIWRIPLELPFMGTQLVAVRILISFVFPIILGFLGGTIYRLIF